MKRIFAFAALLWASVAFAADNPLSCSGSGCKISAQAVLHVDLSKTAANVNLGTVPNKSLQIGGTGAEGASIVAHAGTGTTNRPLSITALALDGHTGGDIVWDTREHDNTDFATTSNVAFRWRRFANSLGEVTRAGSWTWGPSGYTGAQTINGNTTVNPGTSGALTVAKTTGNHNQVNLTVGAGTSSFGYIDVGSSRTYITNANDTGGSNNLISIGWGTVASGVPANTALQLNQAGAITIGPSTAGSASNANRLFGPAWMENTLVNNAENSGRKVFLVGAGGSAKTAAFASTEDNGGGSSAYAVQCMMTVATVSGNYATWPIAFFAGNPSGSDVTCAATVGAALINSGAPTAPSATCTDPGTSGVITLNVINNHTFSTAIVECSYAGRTDLLNWSQTTHF